MPTDPDDARQDEQRHAIRHALPRAELGLDALWARYFGLGGTADLLEVDGFLHGLFPLPPVQRDMLAHAVNERLDELSPRSRVPYSRTVRDSRPDSASLAALTALLDGIHLAPPDELPFVLAAAVQTLGLRVTAYLVDYDQQVLVPFPDGPGRPPLAVNLTMAGRAFQSVRMVAAEADGRRRLWVPLLDGVERLGVLEVVPDDATDLNDPGLRTQCRWLSELVGHLLTITTQYGDGIDALRLPRRRSPASELIWELLPPLTAGTGSFVVAGLVEPSHDVCSDAFDYALSSATASLAVFDAAGHDMRGGLVVAAALAAYRSARRAGHSLFEQARTLDETIADHAPAGKVVTGVLAELDLATGRLRYVNAGHPEPLVQRSGKIVKSLRNGRRAPFGAGSGELALGEEELEPDDWLVLFTDGITDARDHSGQSFGGRRLVDFLEREGMSGHPPPETARRMIQTVLSHHGDALAHDATILLARWIHPHDMTL